jgi:quinoprotein glucose dehydrogenase
MFCHIMRVAALLCLGAIFLHSADDSRSINTNANPPKVALASEEGERALKRFRVAPGFKVELFAAEPLLANPVAFAIDEKGRFFVAETFRLHAGVTDIRQHMNWLDEELASTSVQDRIDMMKRHEGKRIADYMRESDRLRLVWDNDGDGKADRSTIFADGFNGLEEGIGSGVLARNGTVYYANIPNLWTFRDEDRNGMADSRKVLHHGFGVRVGFLGHDLHGLRIGPDGKLYFTIGDRGAHVVTKEGPNERIVANHEDGVVYRCNLDGTELEIYARGLRNPQELAFDAYGNLWTGDNNSDGGDPARWVYVVEGGDSGWRIGFQFLNYPNPRGVWLGERMCYPQWPGQPAYIIPPIANIGNGPSGLAYYPGTGLPSRYENHFFLSDFRGSTGSGVHSFGVRPRGAGFEVTDRHEFLWECLVTDGDFGYDGSFYVTDWVEGWNKTGKGRIYRIHAPEFAEDKTVKQTKELFAQGFDTMSVSKLAGFLDHPDMRVRQEAQFAIVAQGPVTAATTLTNIARSHPGLVPRLHAIWGLGQVANRSQLAVSELNRLLDDKEPEVRAQSAKVLGQAGLGQPAAFARLLSDGSPRVRYFAAMALSKVGNLETFPAVLNMLRNNADEDVYLRHAGVMALTAIAHRADVTAGTNAPASNTDASPESLKLKRAFSEALVEKSDAVRMAGLLALRRLASPDIAQFLKDNNPLLVAEAARAINDLPITNALPKLAALIEEDEKLSALSAGDELRPGPRNAILRRVINANYRVGRSNNAVALAAFAATSQAPERLREEALTLLGEWARPSGRDRITGLWRPLERRKPEMAAAALQPHLAALQKSGSDTIKLAATKVAGRLRIRGAGLEPIAIVTDLAAAPALRVEALKSMANNKDPQLAEAVRLSLADTNEVLRKEATRIQAQLEPGDAVGQLRSTLESGGVSEQQNAFATLGTITNAEVDVVIAQWLDKLLAKDVKPELQLDLLDAAARRESAEVKSKLRRFESSRPAADDLRSYRECLVGGDAAEGKKVFLEKVEASCVRCHKLDGEGGEVGPEVTGIGSRKDRQYILESIVFPNKHIAEGFESVVVTLKNETAYAGQLKRETADMLEINSPEDGLIQLRKADIKARERGLSGMPEELRQVLTKHDLRNLVEFLSQLKEPKP